jgi:proton glutamate symport protein
MPRLPLIGAVVWLAAVALAFVTAYGIVPVPAAVLTVSRWAAVAVLVAYALHARTLTTWIVVAIVIGAEVGHDFPAVGTGLRIVSQIFLKLIRTIIAPLIFSTLVVGIAGHSNLRQVGRMGLKALIYFEVVTTFALMIGWGAATLAQAGVGVRLPAPADAQQIQPAAADRSWQTIVLDIFPENIARSIADNEVLQVVVFAVLFGSALAMLPEDRRRPMLAFVESLAETMFRFTGIVMYLAPLAVGAAMAYTVGHLGLGVLLALFKLLATFYVAVGLFIALVLVPGAWLVRVPIRRFARAVTQPVSIAFATASSEAALPRAMEAMERFGVPRQIVAFVMPTGYSFNLDGSTLYLSLGAMFVTQAAGVHLSIGQQFVLLLTLMLTSKGVAGVPRGALVILLGTVGSFGLPAEPVFMILGIDQLMDMLRTAVNVLGNCLATVVVGRWEGEFAPVPDAEARIPAALEPGMRDSVGIRSGPGIG